MTKAGLVEQVADRLLAVACAMLRTQTCRGLHVRWRKTPPYVPLDAGLQPRFTKC